MSEGHEHGSALDAERGGARYRRRLLFAFALVGAYFLVEAVGGWLTNSLALLSDAGHMLTDVIGLGLALGAIHAAGRAGGRPGHTFGLYRLEILAALANAVLLFGVALTILVEAWGRFEAPPRVMSGPMLGIAVVGLLVNVGVFFLLRPGASESLNVEGAYLEVLADLFGSIGVIVAAAVMQLTGFTLLDPLFGVAIGLFVLPRTFRLGRKAVRILLQAAPPSLDVRALTEALCALEGVEEVHDLHVWTLTSGRDIASVHLRVADGPGAATRGAAARRLLRDRFRIDHVTVQVEVDGEGPCGATCRPAPTG